MDLVRLRQLQIAQRGLPGAVSRGPSTPLRGITLGARSLFCAGRQNAEAGESERDVTRVGEEWPFSCGKGAGHMLLPRFMRRESYTGRCAHCRVELRIEREEVEAGEYQCPGCGHANRISEGVRAEYEETRAREEQRRRRAEARDEERARRRRVKQQEREWRETERMRLRQEEMERQQERRQETARRLEAGLCPRCGSASTELTKKGYDTGTGVACCLLGGPLGLLGGLMGSGQTLCVCKACGFRHRPGLPS